MSIQNKIFIRTASGAKGYKKDPGSTVQIKLVICKRNEYINDEWYSDKTKYTPVLIEIMNLFLTGLAEYLTEIVREGIQKPNYIYVHTAPDSYDLNFIAGFSFKKQKEFSIGEARLYIAKAFVDSKYTPVYCTSYENYTVQHSWEKASLDSAPLTTFSIEELERELDIYKKGGKA